MTAAAFGDEFTHTSLHQAMLNFYFRKNAELEQIKAMHSSAVLKVQEEHSNTLQELGKTIADFERYLSFINA